MRTEVHTLTAMNADIDAVVMILENSFHWTGRHAVSAMYTKLFPKDDAASFAITQGTGGTGGGTGGRGTGQTAFGRETGG
jgi:hypothetical protein